MTAIQGLRGSGTFDVDHRPKNYREVFTMLEPNGSAPLNALLAMTVSQPTNDPEFKNFRDILPDRKLKVKTAATNSATTIALTASGDNKYALNGAVVVVAKKVAASTASIGEVMHVTADVTDASMTVRRNVGGTAFTGTTGALSVGDELIITGYAAQEGGTSPTAISFDATVATNYTQIFRTAFQVSGTLQNTYLRTGPKMAEAKRKALKLHMIDIERSMFFGKKHETSGTTAQPTRYTGGLVNSITETVDLTTDYDDYGATSAGNLTEEGFDQVLIERVFKYGSKEKLAFVGTSVANTLQQIAKDRWEISGVNGSYGVNLTRYSTYTGDLMVKLHPQFRQIPGMENTMIIIDLPELCYRYLNNRDTQLLMNRQANDADSTKHEYMTECGLELKQDKVHAIIKNWSGRSAS